MERKPPGIIGSQNNRPLVAGFFRSHPLFRVPADRLDRIKQLLAQLDRRTNGGESAPRQ